MSELLGREARWLRAHKSVRRIDSPYAVKLKIPILSAFFRLKKYFNARVFANRRLICAVLGPQIICPYKEVDIKACARMSHSKRGQRTVRVCCCPVEAVDRFAGTALVKYIYYGVGVA